MSDKIKSIEQLRDEFHTNNKLMQETISAAKIDYDTAQVLDRLMQLNCYIADAIIEYLENNS